MAVKKSELYSSLWASCDKLRGGMDASQYKDYILTLLFIKYVTDKFKGVAYADIEVPKGGSFDDLVVLIGNKNIGEGIDKVIAKLAEANNLRGIIDNAHFNDETKLGKGKEMVDKLSGLISIFRRPELNFSNNRADGDDIIGDAYEYLMRNFATESGKSKGQFYTPAEISRILAKVIGIDKTTKRDASIYDPACGSGSLLIRAANEAPFEVSIYGQEKDISTAGLAKMNLVLHNKADGEIAGNCSTFSDPQFFEDDEEKTMLRRFDFIVANPPFSTKNWTDGLKEYGRFDGYGDRPPEKNGDYAWLLHILKSLKRNGKAAVILPHGVLFRGNSEATIRKSIIDKGYIKSIISLPPNLFYGTGIPACIIIIDKEYAETRKGIFIIDASNDFIKDGNKNRLRECDIYKIVTTFNEEITDNPKYARFVSMEEIKEKNDYNLNIPRYIDSNIPEDLQSIEAHLNGGIPDYDVDSLDKYWNIFKDLKNVLFSKLSNCFYKLNIPKDEVRQTIYADKEFSKYADRVDIAFNAWKNKVNGKLCGINSSTQVKTLIIDLADEILSQFESVSLIDKYDVYQVLLSYWSNIMADDVYVITQDGFSAARETENIMGVYSSGKKKGEEKVIDWDGKLIPKKLIINHFFSKERKAVDDVELLISERQNQFDAMIEEAEDNSIINEVLKDNGSLDTKALKNKLAETEKAKDKEDYNILKKVANLKVSIDERNKALKALKDTLDKKAKSQYAKLTNKEIIELLINKKWYYSIYEEIDSLYTSISHNIAHRIMELADRYEYTLSDIESEVKKYEIKAKSHLERMGFAW